MLVLHIRNSVVQRRRAVVPVARCIGLPQVNTAAPELVAVELRVVIFSPCTNPDIATNSRVRM